MQFACRVLRALRPCAALLACVVLPAFRHCLTVDRRSWEFADAEQAGFEQGGAEPEESVIKARVFCVADKFKVVVLVFLFVAAPRTRQGAAADDDSRDIDGNALAAMHAEIADIGQAGIVGRDARLEIKAGKHAGPRCAGKSARGKIEVAVYRKGVVSL